MNPVELILRKRNGLPLLREEMQAFVSAYLNDAIPEYQMAAMLMAIFFRDMTPEEVQALTGVYIESGERISFPADWLTVDKHSTGGVGDKLSLLVAPLAAACGCRVPMISGRGLGHTGGTLYKLESVPGFRTGFSSADFKRLVEDVGMAIVAQSERLVPADKRIYALRDVTGTVESLPLITASIMSKKIAEGAANLIIDLKVGAGAFMKDMPTAQRLAGLLIAAGEAFGQRVGVVYSNMNAPLGDWVGNAVEVREAIRFLYGHVTSGDQFELTRLLWRDMLGLCGKSAEATDERFEALLRGEALEVFRRFVAAQGGDARVVDNPNLLTAAPIEIPIPAPDNGWVQAIDSQGIGYALIDVGAGRRRLDDALDYAAGAHLPHKIGAEVRRGDLLGRLYCSHRAKGEAAAQRIAGCYKLSSEKVVPQPVVLGRLNRWC